MFNAQNNIASRRPRGRSGMTLVELIIGMAITGVILMALASFIAAVGTGWEQSDAEFARRSASSRGGQQLHQTMRNMLAVMQNKAGGNANESAYMFYWKSDSYGTAADGKAQFGEMALLDYDPTTKAIWLYECKPTSGMTAAEKVAAASDNWGDPTSAATVTYFKSSSCVATARAIVGGTRSSSGGVDVTSAKFEYFAPTGAKPLVTYDVTLDDGGTTSTTYGSVTLRAAQAATNFE